MAIRDNNWVLTATMPDRSLVQKLNNDRAMKQRFLNKMNAENDTAFKIDDTEIIDITGKHICPYCGDIAEGEYEDLLCADCRMTFGHALYSEL